MEQIRKVEGNTMKRFRNIVWQALAVLMLCFGIISSQNLSMVVEASGCRGSCPCGPMNCATNACDWGYVSSNGNSFVSNGSCDGHRTFLGPITEVGRSSSVSSYDSNGIRYYTRTTTIVYNVTLRCHLCDNTAPRTTYANSYDYWSETIIPPQDLELKMNKPDGMSSSINKADVYLPEAIQYYTKSGNDVSAYVPSAIGWSFNGFCLTANGETLIYDASGKNVNASGYWTERYPSGYLAYKLQEPLTVYGSWSPNVYSVVYDLAGGTYGSNHPSSAKYDQSFNVDYPTRAGYIFTGWTITGMDDVVHTYGGLTTTASSVITDATTYKNLRSTSGVVKFTANWEGISVKLYGNGNKPLNMSSTIISSINYKGSNTLFDSNISEEIQDMSPYHKGYFTDIAYLSAVGWTFNGWYYKNSAVYNNLGQPQKNIPVGDEVFIDYDFSTFGYGTPTPGNVNYIVTSSQSYTAYWEVVSWGGNCAAYGHPNTSFARRRWWCGGCREGYDPGGGGADWASCPVCGTFGSYPSGGGWAHSCNQPTNTTKIAGTITISGSGNTLTAIYEDNSSNSNNIGELTYIWKNSRGIEIGSDSSCDFYETDTYTVTVSGICEKKTASGSASIRVTYVPDPDVVYTKDSALTVTAGWTPNQYNISYNLNGGSYGENHPTVATYDEAFVVDHPTRGGFKFTGWTITYMDNVVHYIGESITTDDSVTDVTDTDFMNLRSTSGYVLFTANWEYTNFNLYVSSGRPSNMEPTVFIKFRYGENDFVIPNDNNYYSINDFNWVESDGTYIFTYEDGTEVVLPNMTQVLMNLEYRKTFLNNIGYLYADGYVFNSWNDKTTNKSVYTSVGLYDVLNTNIWDSEGRFVGVRDLYVYGSWTPINYDVTYALGGGYWEGSAPLSTVAFGSDFFVGQPIRTGYRFVGWDITGYQTEYASSLSVAHKENTWTNCTDTIYRNLRYQTGDVTFTARWEPLQTVVTFDVNKPEYMTSPIVSTTTKTMTYDSSNNNDVSDIMNSIIGWKFLGWYTSPTGGTQVFTAEGKNNACTYWSDDYSTGVWQYTGATLTLYAHYEPNTYKIKYVLNNGTVSGVNPTVVTYDSPFEVKFQPVLPGAVFVGWDITGFNTSTAKYGDSNTSQTTTPWRSNETVFMNLNPTQDAEVTFTARYKDDGFTFDTPVPNTSRLYDNLTVKTESGLNYTYNTWTAETVILEYSAKDLSGITKIYIKDDTGSPYDEDTYLDSYVWGKATISYTSTGIYNGTLYVEDRASTATNNGLIPQSANNKLLSTYGSIKVDKTKPVATIDYSPEDCDGYNGDVTITVTASDEHSGLHDTAYRWSYLNIDGSYTTGSWTSTNTQTVFYNRSGYVEVRDKVGNIQKVMFKVDWIDKQSVSANVTTTGTAIDGSPIVSTINLAEQHKITTGPLDVEYLNPLYESGLKMNAWSVTDVTLRLSMLDTAYNNGQLIASGFDSITAFDIHRQYAGGVYSTASSNTLASEGNISNSPASGYTGYTYTIGEGYHWINAAFTDKAGITVKQTVGIKVDKTAPTIDVEACRRNTPKLSDYSSAELLTMATNGDASFVDNFSTTFHFEINDKSTVANSVSGRYTEGSGIKSVILTIYDSSNPLILQTYDLTSSPYMTVVGYCDTIEKGLYSATYDCAVNTFKDFPSSSVLSYKITATDNAGNVREATWERAISNFQIRADILSSVDDEYNTVEGKNIVAYFKTGDLGYVDIWTLGYVESVQFDFGNIGSEAVQEIKDGNLLAKYNLGVKGMSGYDRVLPASIAQGYDLGYSKINDLSIMAHYLIPGEYLNEGTGIRIPLLLEIDDYMYCTADFIAKKDGYENKDAAEYYIYDNANTSLHWRVTHE